MKEKVVNSINEWRKEGREEGKIGDLGERRLVSKDVADNFQGSGFSHPQWGNSGRKVEGRTVS